MVVAVPKKFGNAANSQFRIKGAKKLFVNHKKKRRGKIMKRALFIITIAALFVGGFAGLYFLSPLDFSLTSPIVYKASSTMTLPNYFGKEIGIISISNSDSETFLYVRASQFDDLETAYQLLAQFLYEAATDCHGFNNGKFFFYVDNPGIIKLSLGESYLTDGSSQLYVSYRQIAEFSHRY